MKIYVWTDKAEQRAKELGLEERKAGTPAYCGLMSIGMFGQVKTAWLGKGYIEEVKI